MMFGYGGLVRCVRDGGPVSGAESFQLLELSVSSFPQIHQHHGGSVRPHKPILDIILYPPNRARFFLLLTCDYSLLADLLLRQNAQR